MEKKIILLFILFFAQNLVAQQEEKLCSCCSDSYNLFDFWIGDWTVYDTSGKVIGHNTIEKQYDNCLLLEKWRSTGKNKGTSTNYYNKKDNTWNQIWVDNSGFNLVLKGNFSNGKMVLKSDLIEGQKGAFYNQITWTKNANDSVTQVWEIFNEKNIKTQEAFRGIYKKTVKTSEK